MKDFTTLLERYLFDIIGIITPALVAVILYCLIIENCTLKTIINELEEIDYNTMVWSVIIVSLYVLGMIIKVIAIKTYKILAYSIGNKEGSTIAHFFYYCTKYLDYKKNRELQEFFNQKFENNCVWLDWIMNNFILYIIKFFVRIFVGVLYNIAKLLETATTFEINRCSDEYERFYIEFRKELNKHNISSFNESQCIEDDAHQLYKLSSVINRQNELKALFDNFLVKYNLFRSLALLFGGFGLYSLTFNNDDTHYSTACLLIIWFAFHYKYIRYWELCGGDAISTALIYLKTKNNTQEQ